MDSVYLGRSAVLFTHLVYLLVALWRTCINAEIVSFPWFTPGAKAVFVGKAQWLLLPGRRMLGSSDR